MYNVDGMWLFPAVIVLLQTITLGIIDAIAMISGLILEDTVISSGIITFMQGDSVEICYWMTTIS